jgi:hypothetical protein
MCGFLMCTIDYLVNFPSKLSWKQNIDFSRIRERSEQNLKLCLSVLKQSPPTLSAVITNTNIYRNALLEINRRFTESLAS